MSYYTHSCWVLGLPSAHRTWSLLFHKNWQDLYFPIGRVSIVSHVCGCMSFPHWSQQVSFNASRIFPSPSQPFGSPLSMCMSVCVGEETRASTLIVWFNAAAYDTPAAWKLTELVEELEKLVVLESAHTNRRKLILELTRTFSAICPRDTSELAYLESANLSATRGFFSDVPLVFIPKLTPSLASITYTSLRLLAQSNRMRIISGCKEKCER